MKRTAEIDLAADMERVAAAMWDRARRDTFGGHISRRGRAAEVAFMLAHRVQHEPTGTMLLLTRDVGYHSSGWWKNKDYERAIHFSISPLPAPPPMVVLARPPAPRVVDLDENVHTAWVKAIFRENVHLLWAEPPYTERGRQIGVWHHRLFCNPDWSPLLPRGEVYSRELTEAGYKSSSEVLAGLLEDEKREAERAAEDAEQAAKAGR